MARTTRLPKGHSGSETQIVSTAGTIFGDGTAVELVGGTGDKPRLLSWNGRKSTIAAQVEREGKIYQPVDLHPSIWKATRLPNSVADYGKGSDLFTETRELLETHLGFSAAEAALATGWICTCWFADFLSSPPTLFVYGSDMGLAITLFQLLSCICRHPLLLAELNRASLCALMALRPTWLINQPGMTSRLLDFCGDSNYRGVLVPGTRGDVLDLVSSKSIFMGANSAAHSWCEHSLHLALPPARRGLPPLDEARQVQIADHFQPRFLLYRLHHLQQVRQSRSNGNGSAQPMSDLAGTLQTCSPNGNQVESLWLPLLQAQERDALAQRCWDPGSAMIEVLLSLRHASESETAMKELAALTNALLRSRGENREYSEEELGKRLQKLGVHRHRKNIGMVIVFDRANSCRVHQLARSFSVGKSVTGCPDCEEAQVAKE